MDITEQGCQMIERQTCGDCGAKEGQLHVLGCDMEICPLCGNQLIACGHFDHIESGFSVTKRCRPESGWNCAARSPAT
jgi:hypothetical protein